MDLSLVHVIIGLGTLLVGWLGFLEKRLRDIMNDTKERIELSNKLNEAIQARLTEDIRRLEGKVDQLLQVNYQLLQNRNNNGSRNVQD